jgi:CelD/BcsL family acetyltransferase involved in cellulose biosynthesis
MPFAEPFSHQVLETPDAVLREQSCWNRMVDDWYDGNPFLTMEHHQAWLCQAARGDTRMRYIKVTGGGMPLAYFPLLEERTFHRIPARRLGFPRVGPASPILDRRFEGAVLDYFCASVLPQSGWDVLTWDRAAPEYVSAEALLAAFRKAGHLVAQGPDEGNWVYVGEHESFQAYVSSRGASTRRELRRAERRLHKRGDFELRTFRNEECAAALKDYDLVRLGSWKAADPSPVYIREMMRRLGALGQTRLSYLFLSGRPVAAQLWLCNRGRGYSHTCAYDGGYREYSPGTFLLTRMMQSAIEEDGIRRMDFLRGDEPYKQHWANRRLVLRSFAFFPGTARGRILHALDQRVVPYVLANPALARVASFVLPLARKAAGGG